MKSMKRIVSKGEKLTAVLAAVLFALMLVFETGKALIMLLVLAMTGFLMKLTYEPPNWLLRSRLGRWWRR
jgi:uncharacterized membrane protein